jgi:septin family protein
MVVGEAGLGKSTLINSLFLTDLYPGKLFFTKHLSICKLCIDSFFPN